MLLRDIGRGGRATINLERTTTVRRFFGVRMKRTKTSTILVSSVALSVVLLIRACVRFFGVGRHCSRSLSYDNMLVGASQVFGCRKALLPPFNPHNDERQETTDLGNVRQETRC